MSSPPISRSSTKPEQYERLEFSYVGQDDEDPNTKYGEFLFPSYSTSYETYTPNSEGSHHEWKSFSHYKRYCSSGDNLTGAEVIANNWAGSDATLCRSWIFNPVAFYMGEYGELGKFSNDLVQFYDASKREFVPAPADIDGLESRALRSMLPLIKAELSLVNSILELEDLKTAPKRILKSMDTINGYLRLRGWYRRGFCLKALLRQAAGNYLEHMFNISPLISDICGIYTALTRTERRINDLISRAGRPQSKHFAYNWAEFPQTSPEVVGQNISIGYNRSWSTLINLQNYALWRRTVMVQPTSFHAQIQYNYNYTDYQREHALLLATLDALGVNLNPQIAWNAIPWSFIVDWMYGIGQYIGSQKVALMKPQINILRYLWSVRRSRTIQVERKLRSAMGYGYGGFGESDTWVTLPVVRETAYRRFVGLPSASSIESSGLSPMEFSLGAALVLSRRRNPKHGRRG